MEKYTFRFLSRMLLGVIISSVVCIAISKTSLNYLLIPLGNDLNKYDMYFTQISVSFIIVSLVSVFSTDSNTVYGVHIVHYKLMKQKYFSFMDIAAYIMGCLLISTYCLIMNSNCIVIPFFLSIILLVILTKKMIGSYFGKESVKKELERKYKQAKDMNSDEYEKIKKEIVENTYRAIDLKNYQIIEENIELLMENMEYVEYINIMYYVGELLPDLSCNLAKKYDDKFENIFDNNVEKYYELLLSNTVKYIEKNYMFSFAKEMFNLYLYARKKQIDLAIKKYNSIILKNEKNQDQRKDICRLCNRYLVHMYGGSMIYEKTLDEGNYFALLEFLNAYYKMLGEIKEKVNIFKNDLMFSERLYQIAVVDGEIINLIRQLNAKIKKEKIDERQINNLIKKLIDIYCKIYEIEELIEGKTLKYRGNMRMLDTMATESLMQSYSELIKL